MAPVQRRICRHGARHSAVARPQARLFPKLEGHWATMCNAEGLKNAWVSARPTIAVCPRAWLGVA